MAVTPESPLLLEDEIHQQVNKFICKEFPDWWKVEDEYDEFWRYKDGCMSVRISSGIISVAEVKEENFNIITRDKYQDQYENTDRRAEFTLNRVKKIFEAGEKYCSEHHNHPMVKAAKLM